MRKVDFFIVGAPKCGTTSLATYLRYRDDVYMVRPKEPHYFSCDFPNYREVKTRAAYDRLFGKANKNQLIGEASVFYLYSSVALQNIAEYNADAKIVVMLRDPASLLYSLHSQLLFTHDEDVEDFPRAWDLSSARRKNRHIPKKCREPRLLLYDEVAGFKEQIERVYSVAPQENVCIVLFEDFIQETDREFSRVCRFLGLPDAQLSEYPVINVNRRHRFPATSRLFDRGAGYLRRPVKILKRVLGIDEIGVLRKLRQLELKYEDRPPLDIGTKRRICEKYEEDIAFLEKLLDRDLSEWRAT